MRDITGRPIPLAPAAFDGTLQDLYDQHIVGVLPGVEEVTYQHRRLLEYSDRADPLFILRALTSTELGQIYLTASGSRFRPSDNSPAWWMHFIAFNRIRDADVEDAPTHMFEAGRMLQPNINSAGWHVAHIFDAKDRQTNWQSWSRRDLVRRFIRNIHPCNCFYLPRTEWRRYGGDARVIRFIAGRYRERYQAVWKDFVELAEGEPFEEDGSLRYVFPVEPVPLQRSARAGPAQPSADGVVTSYSYSRLCFRADVIEPLGEDDVFEVVTPVGRFRMTKRQFYGDFPTVIASKSYRERGIYHYPNPPTAAMRYRCTD